MSNNHLKQAYDLGAQRALADAGITKTAGPLTRPLLTGLGGAALGTGATVASMPEDASTGEKILSGITGGMLGGAAGLTGFDRFGLKGALGGAALGTGASVGLSKLMPEGEGWGPMTGRALAEGTRGSLAATLLASSLMPGASVRKGIKEIFRRNLGEDDLELLTQKLRSIYHPGSPVTSLYGPEGVAPFKIPEKVTRYLDYNAGSPQMGKLVDEFGDIGEIPAGKFMAGNVKDIAGGAAVGASLLPLALPAQMLAEAGKERQKAEEGSWLDKLKYKMKQMRD